MRYFGKTLGVLIGLALVAALGIGGYLGAKRIIALLARLDFQVEMVAAIGALALLLSAMIIAGSIRRAGALGREVQLHSAKAEAYRIFIGLWEQLFQSSQGPEGVARFARQMQEVNLLLVLHGSAAVVKAHTAMQTLGPEEALAEFGNALIEIRKDLGLGSHGLSPEDLAQVLLTEPDNVRGSSRSSGRQDRQARVSTIARTLMRTGNIAGSHPARKEDTPPVMSVPVWSCNEGAIADPALVARPRNWPTGKVGVFRPYARGDYNGSRPSPEFHQLRRSWVGMGMMFWRVY